MSGAAHLTIPDPEAMEQLGARIATQLRAGDTVLLTGELGAGKTTLTRGLGAALGVRSTVTSPTFVLARTHPRGDGPPLVHVDAYRLADARELDDLNLDFTESITVVEWGAGLLEHVIDEWLAVTIARPHGAGDDDSSSPLDPSLEPIEPRNVTIEGVGARWADLGWLHDPGD
ncbi:tRNA (adenosine(37)-N6)-threonylcarbamoyltransferase complex ATPase subunit type 1 TsaE [Microcella pacifica]|nr:tRNA (adenosine(37)-N6)-threonylcarbamoyltransferase complex ATPase subunit type 1 TsaE [Microcella pacifica]